MKTWKVPLPGGHVYEVDTPDDVAKEDVQAYAEEHHYLTSAYDTSDKGHQERVDALVDPMVEGAQAGGLSGLGLFNPQSLYEKLFNSQP